MRRFCYADPPYKGQAKKHYGAQAEEVDFIELITRLDSEFDGWALSVHQNQLHDLLNVVKRVRIGVWVKPFAVFKKNVNPTYAWEPVLFKAPSRGMDRKFVHDWVACSPQMKAVVVGQKPLDFCFWMFQLLGLKPGDEFIDMFPGSGNVLHAYELYIKHFNDVEFKNIERLSGSVRDERPELLSRSGMEIPNQERESEK